MLLKGLAIPDIQAEFKRMVEDPSFEAVQVRGEWCVPRFVGLERLRGTRREQRSETSRVARVSGAEDLRQLQDSGSTLREQFRKSVVPTAGASSGGRDAPMIDADVADQPTRQRPVNAIGSAIQREVAFD